MTESVTAKSHIYVGPVFNAVPTIDDFEAVNSWTEIGNTTDLGSWGSSGTLIEGKMINDPYVRRYKGTIDSGTVDLVASRDPQDAGQNLLRTAATSSTDTYLFKVELSDKIVPSGEPSIFYFRAVVGSAKSKFGDADTVVSTTFTLGITGQIFEVPATVPLTWMPAAGALPAATHEVAYNQTIAATGGVGTVSYAVTDGALPGGLTLNSATGVISGTPSAAGNSSFTITATYTGAGEDEAEYTLAVS